jgi:hypothetical protein
MAAASATIKPGRIRVGKIKNYPAEIFPTYEESLSGQTIKFVQVIVKTKTLKSKQGIQSDALNYHELSPYYLKCKVPGPTDQQIKYGIMENVYQASKIYPHVSAQHQKAKWNNKLTIWDWPAEQHLDQKGDLLPNYWKWREALCDASFAVRYPNGYYGCHECIGSVTFKPGVGWYVPNEIKCAVTPMQQGGQNDPRKTRYVAGRKDIYCPLYGEAARQHPRFKELTKLLTSGVNLLILDVDGPSYSKEFPFNQVEHDSIEITEKNVKALLHDTTQPFGHGYVLAVYLLNHTEWLT